MRVKIMAEGKSIWMDVPDSEGNFIFGELATQLIQLGESRCVAEKSYTKILEQNVDVPEEVLHRLHKNQDGFKGFLHIKCKECGKETSFFSKDFTNKFHCRECGSYTNLYKLVKVKVTCQCGTKCYYQTNLEDIQFDVKCIECKGPVAVGYNNKTNIYESII